MTIMSYRAKFSLLLTWYFSCKLVSATCARAKSLSNCSAHTFRSLSTSLSSFYDSVQPHTKKTHCSISRDVRYSPEINIYLINSYFLSDFRAILNIKLQVQKLANILIENVLTWKMKIKKENPIYSVSFPSTPFLWLWRTAYLFYSFALTLQSVMALVLWKAAKFSAEISDLAVNRKILTGNLRSVSVLYEKVSSNSKVFCALCQQAN